MYDRFTDRVRKVMELANQEAQRFNHEYVGTEHILLGLIKENGGIAAVVLKGVDLDAARGEVKRIIQEGPDAVSGEPWQSLRARKVLEYAIEESRDRKHDYVGTEHLLLGLLRENEGVAARVLRNLDVGLDAAREKVLNLIDKPHSPG